MFSPFARLCKLTRFIFSVGFSFLMVCLVSITTSRWSEANETDGYRPRFNITDIAMICNKKHINLSLAIILLFRSIPTIPCVLVAFSVLKVSIHDLHAVAIVEI